MKSFQSCNNVKHRNVYNVAIFIFIAILVFQGTYFRIRPSDEIHTIDWLVLARLLTCSFGFIIGLVLIPKKVSWGFSAKIIILYVLATGISAVNSEYSIAVIGYFILLSGATMLMIALVYHAQNVVQLEKIEKVWFITVSVLIIKDAITGLLFPEMQVEGGVTRLGMGVTHANQLSFLAGLVFWLSFKQGRTKNSMILWILRIFLVFVIILSISRVSFAAFLFAGFFYYFFKNRDYLKRWIIVSSCLGFLAFFILSLSLGLGWVDGIVDYTKRGQDKTSLSTFTGRTLVWQQVINKSLESPITGHGYGVSKFAIGPLPHSDHQPTHCHNEILEVYFNTGILGLIPFLVILIYSLKWIFNYSRLRRLFSIDLILHAICVIIMLFVSSMLEIRISGRLSPAQPLLFFYLLILDREKTFSISI